jgi:hypothetical protein
MPDDPELRCFEWVSSAQYSEEWRTIVRILRSGDALELVWIGDALANGYLKNGEGVRLHADRLALQFTRPRAKGPQLWSFNVGESICPDNSARMIRGIPYHRAPKRDAG